MDDTQQHLQDPDEIEFIIERDEEEQPQNSEAADRKSVV